MHFALLKKNIWGIYRLESRKRWQKQIVLGEKSLSKPILWTVQSLPSNFSPVSSIWHNFSLLVPFASVSLIYMEWMWQRYIFACPVNVIYLIPDKRVIGRTLFSLISIRHGNGSLPTPTLTLTSLSTKPSNERPPAGGRSSGTNPDQPGPVWPHKPPFHRDMPTFIFNGSCHKRWATLATFEKLSKWRSIVTNAFCLWLWQWVDFCSGYNQSVWMQAKNSAIIDRVYAFIYFSRGRSI